MLSRHEALSTELASTLRTLGYVRAHIIKIHTEAWVANSHLPVTERREAVKVATAHWAGEEAKFQGEVDALRVELNHAELVLRCGNAES